MDLELDPKTGANRNPRVTVLYDGGCGLCRRSVRFLRRFDTENRLEFVDGNDWGPTSSRFPQLDRDRFRKELQVVLPDGRVVGGFDAAAPLSRRLPAFRWFSPLLATPGVRWIGRKIYRAVARRRHGTARA